MAETSFFNKNSEAEIRRRRMMAQRLMEQGKQPQGTEVVSGVAVKQSPIAGLARALQSGLGSYMEGQAAQAETQKAENARDTMKGAMDAYSRALSGDTTTTPSGESITWDKMPIDKAGQMYANMLMQNEDTAPIGMQAMQNNMQNAQQMEMLKQKMAMEAQYAKPSEFSQFIQMSPEMQAKYAAFKGGAQINIDPNTGQIIPPARKLSAAEQKEVFDLQDKQAAIEGALSGLQGAQSIYNRTGENAPYTGMGADVRAAASRVPLIGDLISDTERAAATTSAKNLVTEQALNNMKAIFGGNPTEGERAILLQLQALPTMTPQEQKVIIDTAIQAANRRKENYAQRMGQLETGQYFSQPVQSQNPYAGQGNPAINQDYSQIQPLLETDMNAPAPQMQGANMPPPAPQSLSFGTPQEAEAANLPSGTVVMINGRKAVIE